METINVFVSYAHEDTRWVTGEGKQGLIGLLRQRLKKSGVEFWSDVGLRGGDRWSARIADEISKSQIAILLISEDFAASDYIQGIELPLIRQRTESGAMFVIPILAGSISARTREDLEWVLGFQVVPNDQRSLTDCTRHDADWEQVRTQVLDAIDHVVKRYRARESGISPLAVRTGRRSDHAPAASGRHPAEETGHDIQSPRLAGKRAALLAARGAKEPKSFLESWRANPMTLDGVDGTVQGGVARTSWMDGYNEALGEVYEALFADSVLRIANVAVAPGLKNCNRNTLLDTLFFGEALRQDVVSSLTTLEGMELQPGDVESVANLPCGSRRALFEKYISHLLPTDQDRLKPVIAFLNKRKSVVS